MRVVKELNGWTIKKKSVKEADTWNNTRRPYSIYSPNGLFMKEDVNWIEAIDWCKTHHIEKEQ